MHKLLAGSISLLLLAGVFVGESFAQETDSSKQILGSSEVAAGPQNAVGSQCATIRSWDSSTQFGGDLAVGASYSSLQTHLLNHGVNILPGVAGGSLDAAALGAVDAFLWGSTSHVLTGAEATALNNFVQNGGWLILETDSFTSDQTSSNSGYNALGLGNRVGATAGGNVGGTFENVVTATTVGPLGDLRTLSFDGSVARAIDDTGHTLVGKTTVPHDTWVEFSVGSGGVLGLGDPYGFNLFSADNNDEAYTNFILSNHCLLAAIGGDLIPLDSTMVLVAGTQYTAAWMIPAIVSAIGIAIVIARKF